jgi:hypothetical protein
MSLSPLDLIGAHPWKRVAFATYAVSLSFVEAVILDRLVRGGASQALILADVHGVKAALSELGAQRVGKDYELEPVAVEGGVFHPKVSVLADGAECHLLVGSGNLTFNGWGGSCEILEHLHAGFAPEALADAAGFFEALSVTTRVRQSARVQCAAVATDLRKAAGAATKGGGIRFIHNLNASLEEQIAQFADDLGGAKRLAVMAPYYDGAKAMDSLAKALGLSKLLVHAHKHGCVESMAAQNWPRGGKCEVEAVRLNLLDKMESRRLHAKAFEILCKRGRIVISGSANGTTAALGPGRNVEACVVRLQRGRMAGWQHTPSEPLDEILTAEDEQNEDRESTGVLRAALDADQLTGEVFTPKMSGVVSVFLAAGPGPAKFATTTLSPDGRFSVSAPLLEERSWTGGRLVIRVQDAQGRAAEGFVSVVSFGDITRRAGLLGRRLFALLAGSETPADVAAIMSWFYEDPDRMGAAAPSIAISATGGETERENDELIPTAALSNDYAAGALAAMAHHPAAQRNWSRFMDHILAAFRTARTPLGQTAAGGVGDDDDEEEEGSTNNEEAPAYDPAIEKSLAVFERLFDLLTEPGAPPRHALIAFDLTQYVCARLRPGAAEAKGWLEQLIRVLIGIDVPEDRRGDVAAAVLTIPAMQAEPDAPAYRWARHCLRRLRYDLDGRPPDSEGVRGFAALLPGQSSFTEIWPRLQSIRTFQEQVRAYLKALDSKTADEKEYPDLPREAHAEWPVLGVAITDEKMRARIAISPRETDACPKCFITLPASEAARLRSLGIATAKSCCGRVVICVGD